MRVRNCCFTAHLANFMLNAEGEAIFEQLDFSQNPVVTFAVWQLEQAPETGRYHFQGYLELSKQQSIAQVQSFPGLAGCHIEPRRGSQEQAIEYCEKDESRTLGPWYHGERR